jgi:MFS family permease
MATENNGVPASTMSAVIFSSTIGTAIEWYDFFLYGTMATLVFPKVFFPQSSALVGTLLALFTFLVGFIARPFGCVIMAAFAFPYFLLMNTRASGLFILAVVLSVALCHAWVYGPQAALIAERFGTRSRYSGASLGHQLAAPFAGGLAPIIALVLLTGKSTLGALGLDKVVINIGAGSWQNDSIYIIILAAISFACVLGLRELTKADISNVEAFKITEEEITLAPTD